MYVIHDLINYGEFGSIRTCTLVSKPEQDFWHLIVHVIARLVHCIFTFKHTILILGLYQGTNIVLLVDSYCAALKVHVSKRRKVSQILYKKSAIAHCINANNFTDLFNDYTFFSYSSSTINCFLDTEIYTIYVHCRKIYIFFYLYEL